MNWLCCLCVLCAFALIPSAQAQQKITASITVTNKTTNSLTFTVNGSTRTFTNNVFNSATMVLTNSDVTGCGSKSNLLDQIRANPFVQVTSADTGSNSFNLVGNANLAMAVSASGAYASITYSTQTVSGAQAAMVPISALPTAIARTNVASGIVGALNAVENTNPVHQVSLAASELMGLTNGQTISGVKIFTNAAGQFFGIISNSPAISGTVIALIGGLFTAPILDAATITNGVNYGDAFSSPGPGVNSEQFGHNALAQELDSLAVGRSASVGAERGMAIGNSAGVSAAGGIAIGYSAQISSGGVEAIAIGTSAGSAAPSATAVGNLSSAIGTNSTAVGQGATAAYANSTAIGQGAITTGTNQVMLGAPGSSAVVPNTLAVGGTATISGGAIISGGITMSGGVTISGPQTNGAYFGTNNFLANADIAFTRKAVSSLANGVNAAVPIGTNMFIQVSGPSGAFSIDGIANGRDGKLIILQNSTGQTLTIANESGSDATAANRILTGLSGNYANTNNPGCVTLIYNGSSSRWILVSHN